VWFRAKGEAMTRWWKRWQTSRWIAFGIGVAAIVAGAALTLKPFSSLDALVIFVAVSLVVTGLGEFATERTGSKPWVRWLVGVVLIGTGLVALFWPDATVRSIGIAVGIGLVIGGLTRLVDGLRGQGDDRYVSLVGGLSGLVIGMLALAWRDATILVVAMLVGPVAVIFGVGQVVRALTGNLAALPESDEGVRPRTGWQRVMPVVKATGALLLALALVGVSAWLNEGGTTVDAFYDAPDDLPDQPGQLVRSEPFQRGIPDEATAWLILYTTTTYDGSIGVGSSLVVVPEGEAAGPRPVILWTHGTTGIVRTCAPSLTAEPMGELNPPSPELILDRGWALIMPDYTGLGTEGPHPYLVGKPTAYASLDAVRAARQIEGLDLTGPTMVWGHSQGGAAALWVGIEAASYAPDVPLSGVAGLAPASDLVSLASVGLSSPMGMLLGTFVLKAYSQIYPDVAIDDYLRASARAVMEEAVARCTFDRSTLLSVAAVLSGEQIFSQEPTSGPMGARLVENIPDTPTGLPTFIGQGDLDTIIHPEVQRQFVEGLCSAGQSIDYRIYAGRDHLSLVDASSPLVADVLEWTQARFDGEPMPAGCSTSEG
jgi:uncharacterized membrane protein HdeD (DUF308 family)/alpha-beta hydrolase superfamily lysophospholipase